MTVGRAFDRTRSFRERFGGAALVTGASAGIGEAFARALAARGMDLVLVARRNERLVALARELSARHGVRADAVAHDLARPDVHRSLPAAVAELGVDVGLLVNNAGFGAYGPFAEADIEAQARMVDLNCRAPVLLTHAFLPAMLARGTGGIVIVASIAAYQPAPFLATYGATKAFDLMLGEALWAELRGQGIAVLALSPGSTPTEFQRVAGSERLRPPALTTTADEVVVAALDALGVRPSVVPGAANALLVTGARLGPRSWVARLAHRVNRPAGPRKGGAS